MNDVIKYRPNRSNSWFVPFMLICSIIAFVGIGYCLPKIGFPVYFLFVFGIMGFLLAKTLYDSSNIIIIFENEGLRIAGGKHNNYHYTLWEDINYAYYARNFKGHLFLILSPESLSQKQVKHFMNRGANTSRICVDSVMVIHIDELQDITKLRELINNKVLHIATN